MAKNSTNLPIDLPYDQVLMDPGAFEAFLKDHGIPMLHYRAVKCPLGVIDVNDSNAPHYEHGNCDNGFIYELVGEVTVFFSNNSAVTSLTEMGVLDGSTVQITLPRYYNSDESKEVYVQLYDRFFVKNISALTPTTQLVEYNPTGIDKLQYKAIKAESLIDSNGIKYGSEDFSLQNGTVVWTGSSRPGINPDINRGVIYSIRYLYEPYFYVTRLIHEVRILNKSDFMTGKPVPVRAPYAALISREYYQYKNKNNTDVPGAGADDMSRNMMLPRDSIFPPR